MAGVCAGGAQEEQECSWCPRCPPPPASCAYSSSAADEHFYRLDDGTLLQISSTAQYVKVWCRAGAGLESASLPRFPYHVQAPRVILRACPPPAASYARALRNLNVSAPAELVLQALPAAPPLRADHLAGLHLRDLALLGAGGKHEPRLPAALLAPLSTLRTLHLQSVRAPSTLQLPRGLRVLRAAGAGLGALLGRERLAALPELRALVLTDPRLTAPPALDAAPALRHVTLYAPLDALPPLAHLHNFTLIGARNLTLTGGCGSLRRLRVERPRVPPPPAWLAACPSLQVLELVALPPAGLPPDLLATATLRALTLQRCSLADLPPALLAPARLLRSLHLTHNRLRHLDRYAFAQLSELEELDLSFNLLTAPDVRLALAPLTGLRALRLAGNPLGDLCAPPDPAARIAAPAPSGLRHLQALRELSLAGTGAAQVCADWRRDMRALRRLDLRHNNITELQYSDLEWGVRAGGAGRALLDLSGNPVRAVLVSPADYERAAARPPPAATVEVELTGPVSCDCTMYWFSRALRARLLPATFPRALLCAGGGRPLALLDPRDMECAAEAGCPAGCACSWRAWDAATVVRCAGAGVAGLPALPAAPRLVLLAAHNRITDDALPAHLPPALQELDLSDNLIADVTEDAARALLAPPRRLRLARNPLACHCHAALIRHLPAHRQQVLDYEELECADGGAVRVAVARCVSAAGAGGVHAALAGAAGALLAAAALMGGGAVAARRHTRLRLKAFLLARGLCLRWARPPDDDGCKYDVFLSYSHRDSAVAEQLVAALEGGPRPLRLCLHHRDWRAGDWIPAQIARSVSESRRTVVLLSEHFARSSWARAEFREAAARAMRAARPTLVVVLLGAAPPAGLDAELMHYVRNNTYVRWGEPAFWEKLRLALPAPRAPPATPPTTPRLRPHARPPLPPAPVHRTRTPPAPPTPVVKFSPLQFPAVKGAPAVTSPCA